MDGNSDYLTLWTHCEGRGYDEKNRMMSFGLQYWL
jgi:hypothetical protein